MPQALWIARLWFWIQSISFSYTSCRSMAKEPSLPFYLPISWEKLTDSYNFKGKSLNWNANSFAQDLSGSFHPMITFTQHIYVYVYQSQVKSYQRLRKLYLMPPCLTLSIISYGSRLRWSNPGKGVMASSILRCSSYWKESLQVTLDYRRPTYLYICRHLYIWKLIKKL